jgi:hypothetical protein
MVCKADGVLQLVEGLGVGKPIVSEVRDEIVGGVVCREMGYELCGQTKP